MQQSASPESRNTQMTAYLTFYALSECDPHSCFTSKGMNSKWDTHKGIYNLKRIV